MKRIRANASAKIAAILAGAAHIEYFLDRNKYRGGEFSEGLTPQEQNFTKDDIKNGYAVLYKADGYHVLRYAGRCKWIIKGAAA
jgi:hypothetical protein